MTDIEQREPVAAYTVDLTGCEHLSLDVANIERIAAAGSEGPTAVHHLYTGQQLAEVEARVKELEGAIRWAHETLYEINPSNYDHSEVCKINDASVEVILGLAPLLDERHGKTFEWWVKYSTEEATRRAATAEAEAERLRALVEEAKNSVNRLLARDPEETDDVIVYAFRRGVQTAARSLRDRLGVEG